MKFFSKGFCRTFGICLAILVVLVGVLCIVQAIRMAGSDGLSYADMWHNWSAFFPKKGIVDIVDKGGEVVATMFKI